MTNIDTHKFAPLRRLKRALVIGLAFVGLQLGSVGHAPAETSAPAARSNIYATAYDYVANFYPVWFTYYQWLYSSDNRFAGPEEVTPLYEIVVAINVDTIYASTVLALESQPIVVNIPSTPTTFSILSLDPFGNVLDIDMEAEAGTYVFTGPDYDGSVPVGLTEVQMPFNTTFFIIRADKYSVDGKNLTKKAEKFRKALTSQTLSDFLAGETPQSALVLPEIAFALPFKYAADNLVKYIPVTFLKQLQKAVQANYSVLSSYEQTLSDKFDSLFSGGSLNVAEEILFSAGTRDAHDAIIDRYLDTRGSTNWTHFTNIGKWGKKVIDRAAITEFCQYCNTIDTAAYYHAFYDNKGKTLDGTDKDGYVLKIPKSKIPDVTRFWSLTAYTPETVELVSNSANKYVVASYTSGLTYNSDGSLSIYLARKRPSGVPKANWLPVPTGQFNVMLRLYGPVDASDYLPPAIKKR